MPWMAPMSSVTCGRLLWSAQRWLGHANAERQGGEAGGRLRGEGCRRRARPAADAPEACPEAGGIARVQLREGVPDDPGTVPVGGLGGPPCLGLEGGRRCRAV